MCTENTFTSPQPAYRVTFTGTDPNEPVVERYEPGTDEYSTSSIVKQVRAANGPIMLKAEDFTGPQSLLDLSYEDVTGMSVLPGFHVAPKQDSLGRRDYSSLLIVTDGAVEYFEIVSSAVLHKEAKKQRGGYKLLDKIGPATKLKRGVWSGKNTIRAAAKELGVSVPTAMKMVHGESYWYA